MSSAALDRCLSPLAATELVRRENRLGYGLQMGTTNGLAVAIGEAVGVLPDFFQRAIDGRDPVQVVGEYRFVVEFLFKAITVVDGIPGFIACRSLQRIFIGAGRIATGNQFGPQFELSLALAGDECIVEIVR